MRMSYVTNRERSLDPVSRHNNSNIILAHIFFNFNGLSFFRYKDFGLSFVYYDKSTSITLLDNPFSLLSFLFSFFSIHCDKNAPPA